MRSAFLVLLVGLSCIAGTAVAAPGGDKASEARQRFDPVQTDAIRGQTRERCDPRKTGGVYVTANGVAGDSFRVRLECGGRLIAWCVATIPPGATSFSCEVKNQRLKRGMRSCQLGRGHDNSAGANAQPWGCS